MVPHLDEAVTEIKRRRIDQIQSPEFTVDLTAIDIDELRRRRQMCSDLDTELSYYRRLLHGRMDLLAFELRRRGGEEERTLLEALPEILAGGAASGPGFPERLVEVDIPDIPQTGRRAIDRVLADDFLARLPVTSEEELAEIEARLVEVESEVSRQRRAVFEAYDLVQAEITRRYRDGITGDDAQA